MARQQGQTPRLPGLAPLFDRRVSTGSEPCTHDLPALLPAERPFVERAVATRRREFASARVCARRLLAALGHHDAAVLPDADRCPTWPTDIAGSIAHTREICVVAVAPRNEVGSLGIDIEPRAPIEAQLWDTICTKPEQRWISDRDDAPPGEWARCFFGAKEAFYKAQFPRTRAKLGFHDVSIHPVMDQAGRVFDVEVTPFVVALETAVPTMPDVALRGTLVRTRDHILAGVALD